jgi:hypothetical protein
LMPKNSNCIGKIWDFFELRENSEIGKHAVGSPCK